jgi:hypothetical protein
MDAETVGRIMEIAEAVVGRGGSMRGPQTIEVRGVSVTINSLSNGSTEDGYSIQWTRGNLDFTVVLKATGPFGKIVPY